MKIREISGHSPPDVTVCLINHNARELTVQCLESIRQSADSLQVEVVLVDNTPGDGCGALVREQFPDVVVIDNTAPASFTVNNNRAIARSAGRYVLVLNNDTIVKPGALDTLVRFMDAHPECGACSARLTNPDGTAQYVSTGTPTLRSYAYHTLIQQNLSEVSAAWRRLMSARCSHTGPVPVDNLSGACMFLRREVVEQVGGFDEAYNFYFEDCDLSRRIRQAGWQMHIVPDAEIVHFGGASLGRALVAAKIEEYRSACRFFPKHGVGGPLASVFLKTVWLVASGIRLPAYVVLALAGRPGARRNAGAYARILFWHLGLCRG